MEKCFIIFVIVLQLITADDSNTRCTAKELKQFSEEYETCHQRALETIKSNTQVIK